MRVKECFSRRGLLCGVLMIAGLLHPAMVLGQTTPVPRVEHSVAMKTRDGVTLRADIYRPATEGKYPVLLQRTPYNKDGAVSFAMLAVARG